MFRASEVELEEYVFSQSAKQLIQDQPASYAELQPKKRPIFNQLRIVMGNAQSTEVYGLQSQIFSVIFKFVKLVSSRLNAMTDHNHRKSENGYDLLP